MTPVPDLQAMAQMAAQPQQIPMTMLDPGVVANAVLDRSIYMAAVHIYNSILEHEGAPASSLADVARGAAEQAFMLHDAWEAACKEWVARRGAGA